MIVKELMDDLEKGDRTKEMLKVQPAPSFDGGLADILGISPLTMQRNRQTATEAQMQSQRRFGLGTMLGGGF